MSHIKKNFTKIYPILFLPSHLNFILFQFFKLSLNFVLIKSLKLCVYSNYNKKTIVCHFLYLLEFKNKFSISKNDSQFKKL